MPSFGSSNSPGSSDALIGSVGILEIKCPFLIRNEDPKQAIKIGKLSYCDKNGKLKTNSDYYFQIQGLLEITGRDWCDFFIFTKKGYHVQRISRNKEMWNDLYLKLKSFYYYFMVPSLVHDKVVERPIRWTLVQQFSFLENGLIDNCQYYCKQLKRNLYIGFYSEASCEIKEIVQEDFLTLLGSTWLSNFIVDICLNTINKLNRFSILTCNLSTAILIDGIRSETTLKIINNISKDVVAMPFMVNNNHYCLAIADFSQNCFTYFDPYGREDTSTYARTAFNFFLQILEVINRKLNKTCNVANWTLCFKKHVTQNDSYNCGIHIIYFFKQLCSNESLESYVDPSQLRADLMTMLLKNSDSVFNRFMYCGRSFAILEALKCYGCNRLLHDNQGYCATIHEIENGLCELCELQ